MPPSHDIADWKEGRAEYHAILESMGKAKAAPLAYRGHSRVALQLDVPRCYALLTLFVAPKPNGFMTFFIRGKPMDNMIWWDFVLAHEGVVLHVMRTVNQLEAVSYLAADVDSFDAAAFIESNIQRHRVRVDEQAAKFEKHSVYINHYYSYQQCAEWLRDEIDKIDISVPKTPALPVLTSEEELQSFQEGLDRFMQNSRRFHILAKSLVLHSAFMSEAALNNLFRIGAAPPLRESPAAMKLCLRANFGEKLRILETFSVILEKGVDMSERAVADALKLMELRNKYVHADESSEHNRLGHVFYDGDFPLLPSTEHAPAIELALRSFHAPSLDQVRKAHDSGKAFVEYLLGLVDSRVRRDVERFFEQHHIGYNETRKVYSSVYDEQAPMFVMRVSKDDK